MATKYRKLLYIDNKLLKINYMIKLKQTSSVNSKQVILIKKSLPILNCFLNKYVYIYKGSKFKKLKISSYNIGLKLGNFIVTRKPFNYPLTLKKKLNKR